MDGEPEARARLAQEFFSYLDEYRPGLRDEVASRVSPAYLELVNDLPPTEWVAFELTSQGVEAAVDVLGERDAPDLWRKAFIHRFSKTPIIGGLIAMWTRLFGLSPGSLVKAVPKGFEGTYRNLMRPDIDVQDKAADIVLDAVHDQLFDHERYLIAFHGTFEGFFEMCHVDGTVTRELERDARRVRFSMRW